MAALKWDIKIRCFIRFAEGFFPGSNWTFLQTVGGLGLIVGGLSLMSTYFWLAVGLVYLGFFCLFLECVGEPKLSKRPYWRLITFGMVLSLAIGFSLKVVFVSAPLFFDSYAKQHGDYPQNTVIAGIQWNPHFTDLRVWIKNTTKNDYEHVDLAIQPDKWNYKAAIVDEHSGCDLRWLGGNGLMATKSQGGATNLTLHREGDHFETDDNAGDIFEHFLNQGGYRLICDKLPAHSDIQVVFALAAVNHEYMSDDFFNNLRSNAQKTGEAYGYERFKNVNSLFDLLGKKPSPSTVTITGHYSRGARPYSISQKVKVGDGN